VTAAAALLAPAAVVVVVPSAAVAQSAGTANGSAAAHAATDALVRAAGRTVAGTSWQPDAAPRDGLHARLGSWTLMLHGAGALAYAHEQSPKGGKELGAANWAMGGASRPLAGGLLGIGVMASLETLTLGDCGYPRLLARGARCPAESFGEYQHPHAPLSELSVRYARPLTPGAGLELFVAAVGEPAIGPVPYMHRASSAYDPIAPMSAHETNPAHASEGVATVGVVGRSWKVEASLFDGAVANPNRVLPEVGPFDSRAVRVTLNPGATWSIHVSGGRIAGASGHHPGATGVIRAATAGAAHSRFVGSTAWSSTVVWSVMDDGAVVRHAWLLESSAALGARHAVFARAEVADRPDVTTTIIENPDGTHDHLLQTLDARAAQLSAGYVLRQRLGRVALGVGGRASVSFVPEALRGTYREPRAWGFAVFASIRPVAGGAGPTHGQH
jgi:hypothetical protein